MKLFDNCLIACDIDGTLMTNGIIPKINREKIIYYMENGGAFAIATGRSVCAVSDVWEQLPEVDLGTYGNGTIIFDKAKKELLYDKTIPLSDHEIMYEINKKHPDVGIEVHYQDNVGVFSRTEETDLHIKYERMETVDLKKEEIGKLGLNKILYLFNSFEEREEIKPFINSFSLQSDFVDTTVTYYGRQRFFIEQIPKGISKATGVTEMAKLLGTAKGCIYAIGDYYNDLEMLSAADIGAVPEDSPEDVKINADFITKSAENGAVADFIDYLTKIRRK